MENVRLITLEHIKEDLSLAYIRAVAAKAGVIVHEYSNRDYKVDGSFHNVQIIGKKREPTGFPIEFQIKATVNWIVDTRQSEPEEIKYDLEVATYNFLIRRKNEGGTPCILVLLCLPPSEEEWLKCSEDELLLRKCCYWELLEGQESQNDKQIRISIPRFQQFTPEAIKGLLLHAKTVTLNE